MCDGCVRLGLGIESALREATEKTILVQRSGRIFLKRIAGGSSSEGGHRASFLDMAGNRTNVSLEFAIVFGNLQLTFCDPRPSSTFDTGPGRGL